MVETTRKTQSITIIADGVPDVLVLHAEAPVQISGGYGGWTVLNRERRVGLTQWQGKDPIRMQVPVLFDGFLDGVGQEISISHLSRMALPPTTGGEPPTVKIQGSAIPKPGPVDWVIESLDWGTNVIWDYADDGTLVRLRQDCTINLLEYRADDRVAFKGIKPGTANKGGWPKTYIVKKGDTLKKIAAVMYGDITKWKLIADANGIRDPKNIRVGQKLRIPAP